jgi:hypothetical protein
MVKQPLRFWVGMLLVAIYCLAVGISTHTVVHADAPFSSLGGQDAFVAGDPHALLSHAPLTERTVSSFGGYSLPGFDKVIDHFWVVTDVAERVFQATFAQYYRFFVSLLILHRKADLLFPFHYFW